MGVLHRRVREELVFGTAEKMPDYTLSDLGAWLQDRAEPFKEKAVSERCYMIRIAKGSHELEIHFQAFLVLHASQDWESAGDTHVPTH